METMRRWIVATVTGAFTRGYGNHTLCNPYREAPCCKKEPETDTTKKTVKKNNARVYVRFSNLYFKINHSNLYFDVLVVDKWDSHGFELRASPNFSKLLPFWPSLVTNSMGTWLGWTPTKPEHS